MVLNSRQVIAFNEEEAFMGIAIENGLLVFNKKLLEFFDRAD